MRDQQLNRVIKVLDSNNRVRKVAEWITSHRGPVDSSFPPSVPPPASWSYLLDGEELEEVQKDVFRIPSTGEVLTAVEAL